MNKKAANSEPVFDITLSKSTLDMPNMYNIIQVQLNSPRLKRLHNESTIRNWSSSLACFGEILNQYTADDLRVDGVFDLFLNDIEACLKQSTLAVSTLDNYTQVLHGNLLVFAKVDERIRKEVKQGIRNIRKKQKKTMPKAQAIEDDMIVHWLKNLDRYCEDPKTAPNLFKLARKTSKMAYQETMILSHMLLMRGYVWLTLSSGARTGEILSLPIENVNGKDMTRNIYKMKVIGQEVTTTLPPFIQDRIRPMIAYIKEHEPDALLLFAEEENKKGKGTIDPRLLQELVKGSMIASGMPPTTPGGYHRLHDMRKVWARWIDENGGSLESISAFLGHSSTQVTYNSYFHADHKSKLAKKGQQTGLKHLQSLLAPPEDISDSLAVLRAILEAGGSIYEDCSFSLRHDIERTESARPPSWSKMVPAPMREDTTEIVQPLDRAGNTIKSDAIVVVPAPRLELGTP